MTIAVAVRLSSELPAAAAGLDDGHKIHCRKEFGVTDDDDDQRSEGGRGNVGKVAKYFRPDAGVRKYLVGEEEGRRAAKKLLSLEITRHCMK